MRHDKLTTKLQEALSDAQSLAVHSFNYREYGIPTRIVYGTALSGHTHRVELLMHLLRLPFRRIDVPAQSARVATRAMGRQAVSIFRTAVALAASCVSTAKC